MDKKEDSYFNDDPLSFFVVNRDDISYVFYKMEYGNRFLQKYGNIDVTVEIEQKNSKHT